jgi:hypothetical protein
MFRHFPKMFQHFFFNVSSNFSLIFYKCSDIFLVNIFLESSSKIFLEPSSNIFLEASSNFSSTFYKCSNIFSQHFYTGFFQHFSGGFFQHFSEMFQHF